MTGIKKIADEIGVSSATVSNALSGRGRVSREVAHKIQARARELNYQPSNAARALRTGQSGILGLVVPDLAHPLFPRFAQSLSIAAEARGLGVLIGDSRASEAHQESAIRRLAGRGVDGLIIVPQRGTAPDPVNLPSVTINTKADPRNTVSSDHFGGGRLAGEHIREMGHSKVIILGAHKISTVQQERVAGMRAGLGEGVSAAVIWDDAESCDLAAHVKDGATAVLTTSDLVAVSALSRLARAGIVAPRDVSLTGFDDLPVATAIFPALTTIAQDMDTIAGCALDVLTGLIRNDESPAPGRIVPMRLIARQSVSPPRTG